MVDKRYEVKHNHIHDNHIGKILNIDFNTKIDAELCCKLLNQKENEKNEYVSRVHELNKWYEEYYGKTILEEKLGL